MCFASGHVLDCTKHASLHCLAHDDGGLRSNPDPRLLSVDWFSVYLSALEREHIEVYLQKTLEDLSCHSPPQNQLCCTFSPRIVRVEERLYRHAAGREEALFCCPNANMPWISSDRLVRITAINETYLTDRSCG